MRMHEREALVRSAQAKIHAEASEALVGLTEAEALRVLSSVLGDQIGLIAKCMIREERHGDQDKPGDVA